MKITLDKDDVMERLDWVIEYHQAKLLHVADDDEMAAAYHRGALEAINTARLTLEGMIEEQRKYESITRE